MFPSKYTTSCNWHCLLGIEIPFAQARYKYGSTSSEKLKIFSETKIAIAMFTEISSLSASDISFSLLKIYAFVDVSQILKTIGVELLEISDLKVVKSHTLEEGRVDNLPLFSKLLSQRCEGY